MSTPTTPVPPRFDPVTGEEIPPQQPQLTPPPGAAPATPPPQRPRPWWQRFLGSGFALPAMAAIPAAIGLATKNSNLVGAASSFGAGAAEGSLQGYQAKAKEAMEQRQRQFEESQLRVRNLASQVEQYRGLATFATPPSQDPNDPVGQEMLKARTAIGAYDQAMADGTITDAEAKKVHEALMTVDWDRLKEAKTTAAATRTAEAEYRAKRGIAEQGLAEGLKALHPPPTVGPPEDYLGKARAMMTEADISKLEGNRPVKATIGANGELQVPPGTQVDVNAADLVAGQRADAYQKAQERIAAHQAAADAARAAAEKARYDRMDADAKRAFMADRTKRWEAEFRDYSSTGGRARDPMGAKEPIHPEVADQIDNMAETLAKTPDGLARAQRLTVPTQIPSQAAKSRLVELIRAKQQGNTIAGAIRPGLQPPPRVKREGH